MLSLGDDHLHNNMQVKCALNNTVKKCSRVSTYIIDYQGLNSSVIITTYIVVVVKFYQRNCR